MRKQQWGHLTQHLLFLCLVSFMWHCLRSQLESCNWIIPKITPAPQMCLLLLNLTLLKEQNLIRGLHIWFPHLGFVTVMGTAVSTPPNYCIFTWMDSPSPNSQNYGGHFPNLYCYFPRRQVWKSWVSSLNISLFIEFCACTCPFIHVSVGVHITAHVWRAEDFLDAGPHLPPCLRQALGLVFFPLTSNMPG